MIIHSDISPINKIQSILPQSINFCISHIPKDSLDRVSEIRLRKNGVATAVIDGMNVLLTKNGLEKHTKVPVTVTSEEIDDLIYKACKGSVYSHENTINSFFITHEGIRIGLGASVGTNGCPDEITSLNIRLPRHVDNCSEKAVNYLRNIGMTEGKGILVVSAPGVGKTTFLRDIAHKLSSFKSTYPGEQMLRVCVIDERFEIYMPQLFESCCIDFISGTGKITGIERAVRLLSPQVIVCDELSGHEEAEKITLSKNSGTVFVASYHCASAQDALRKQYIRRMFDEGVFGAVCTLTRNGGRVNSEVFVYGEDK